MKMTYLVGAIAAPLMTVALMLPSYAADSTNPTTCKDGTTSAATGKGACSGHGGVQKAAKSAPATGSAMPAAAAPAAAAPAAAAPAAAPAAPAAKSAPATKSAP